LQLLEKEIAVNDIYLPLIDCQSRFLPIYGGAGSGKSVFASFKVVKRTVSEAGHKFLCLRKVGSTVKDSIFAEIKAQIYELEIDSEFLINKTDHSFLHIPSGNQILCKGLDDPAKIKSIKGITGMWLEEATEFEENDLDQLDLRIRGEKQNYVQYILTFNPIDENHWLKKRFFDKKDPLATTCHSTYKDNHFLTAEDKQRLESLKDRNELYYDVYCLGKWGVVIKSNKFLYAYSKDKHEIESFEPNPHLPIMVSFDFNVEPMTAIVSQRLDDLSIVIFDELEIPEGSTEEMVELVKAKYPHYYGNMDITGDATGRNREKVRRGNINSYLVIKDGLDLFDRNIKVPTKNPELKDSRVLCNSVLQHANVKFTKNCEKAINDSIYAQIKNHPNGRVEILKTDEEGRHFLDNVRYTLHVHFPDFIRNPKKYRDAA
jgi:phage terminase large subunit